MIAYHGTVVSALKVLKPFANPNSNLEYSCVYLSTNKALSSIYIWNKGFKWMTFEIREDGIPIYNESFKDCLLEFYGDVKGCIYECEADFETDANTTIKHAVISKIPVAVQSVDIVENAYERILQYEKSGELIINHYDNLSDRQKERDRNMVLGAIKRMDLLKGQHPLSGFVAEKFPEFWREALSSTR